MIQTRIQNPLFARNKSGWPKAVQTATPFVSTDDNQCFLFVYLLDYAIVELFQIFSISKAPFTVTGVIVNGEFHPTLSVVNHAPWITTLQLPQRMTQGSPLLAVLRAPVAATLPPGSCYPKPPVSLVIATDCGEFSFKAGGAIRCATE